jgi:hypothetical protein
VFVQNRKRWLHADKDAKKQSCDFKDREIAKAILDPDGYGSKPEGTSNKAQ